MSLTRLIRNGTPSIEAPQVPLTSASLIDWLSGPQVHAGVAVNETSSLGMPAV